MINQQNKFAIFKLTECILFQRRKKMEEMG